MQLNLILQSGDHVGGRRRRLMQEDNGPGKRSKHDCSNQKEETFLFTFLKNSTYFFYSLLTNLTRW